MLDFEFWLFMQDFADSGYSHSLWDTNFHVYELDFLKQEALTPVWFISRAFYYCKH